MNITLLVIGIVLVILIGLVVVVLSNAMLEIPKPTGSNPVGFRSTTLTDNTRTVTIKGQSMARVLTLDIWYPALSTTGFKAEPYTEKALAKALSQFQKIPEIGGEKPSYSYRDAPIKPGLHKVIVFNHGFGSFTKQNFSNAQELASYGYMIIAIAHPGESLIAKDEQGKPIEFEANLEYQKIMNQQTSNPKAFAQALAAVLTDQRNAANLEMYNQKSQALTKVSPYNQLENQLKNWILDTRFLIEHLETLMGADPKHVVLMGHSFGGITSLELAKQSIPGIVGAINLDGAWLQYEASLSNLRVPLLALLSTQNRLQGQDLGLHATFDMALQSHSNNAYVIEIAGTAHMNFTDLNFIPILRYLTPILGSVDAKRMAQWQNTTILEFLKHLEDGQFGQPLLPEDSLIRQCYFPKI
jgi:dienelactone hydrolase